MRKVCMAFFAATSFVVGSLKANPIKDVKPNENLSAQIHEMLSSNSFNVQNDLVANVRFTINKEGEIVVLSVDTEDISLEGFVKGRLNYQKVELQNIKEGRLYTVPVRIMA
mgnify:CR=1 FL=1